VHEKLIPRSPLGEALLSVQQQFEASQWWPPEQMQRHQFHRLAVLLQHAFETVPFYRDRLAVVGYQPGDTIDEDLWTRIPILTRRDVKTIGERLASTKIPPEHGSVHSLVTTGSTGSPVKVLKTDLEQLFWHGAHLRDHLWHCWDPRGKLAIIRIHQPELAPYPDGRRLADWGPPLSHVFATGPAILLDFRTTTAQQAEWLLREEPDYLLSFPSIVRELALHFRDKGLRPLRLKGVRTVSEVVRADLRELCSEAFGVRPVDVYSAAETGFLALQCPEREHYHVVSESVIVEVLDDRGKPCEPDQVGTVVVTPLHNFAMPLIRYEIGDLARMGSTCPCGRGLPVIAEIMGRTRDMFILPSGDRRYAFFGLLSFSEFRDILQSQLVQKSLHELEVRLVARQQLSPADEANLRAKFAAVLGPEVVVTLSYHEQIPRTLDGKYFDFVSELR